MVGRVQTIAILVNLEGCALSERGLLGTLSRSLGDSASFFSLPVGLAWPGKVGLKKALQRHQNPRLAFPSADCPGWRSQGATEARDSCFLTFREMLAPRPEAPSLQSSRLQHGPAKSVSPP